MVLQTRVINNDDDCVIVGPETLSNKGMPAICKNGQDNSELEYIVENRDHIVITRLLIIKC